MNAAFTYRPKSPRIPDGAPEADINNAFRENLDRDTGKGCTQAILARESWLSPTEVTLLTRGYRPQLLFRQVVDTELYKSWKIEVPKPAMYVAMLIGELALGAVWIGWPDEHAERA